MRGSARSPPSAPIISRIARGVPRSRFSASASSTRCSIAVQCGLEQRPGLPRCGPSPQPDCQYIHVWQVQCVSGRVQHKFGLQQIDNRCVPASRPTCHASGAEFEWQPVPPAAGRLSIPDAPPITATVPNCPLVAVTGALGQGSHDLFCVRAGMPLLIFHQVQCVGCIV